MSMKLIKRNSRKADCPSCYVGTGSRHNIHCKYAFTGFTDAKSKNKKVSRIKLAIKILLDK